MPVDYSKWDALELSDDSDIEVHPNVDKRSFIRAKQSQIHMERDQRRHQIDTLHYERLLNDELISRMAALLTALRRRVSDAARLDPSAVAFDALMESCADRDDMPPPRPANVHSNEKASLPTYTAMLSALLDKVNKTLDEQNPPDRYAAIVHEVGQHLTQAQDLQEQLLVKLAALEKADRGKITSDSYHTGFDRSQVSKEQELPRSVGEGHNGSSDTMHTVELLNPKSLSGLKPGNSSSRNGNDGDDSQKVQQLALEQEEDVSASPDARQFAQIAPTDYQASLSYIQRHPALITERETDGLLVLALDAVLEGRETEARRSVHQALLLQYCRALGQNGVGIFFKRITTPGHQAQAVFYKDVQETFVRIRDRGRTLRAELAAQPKGEPVEQIQLQAVDPGTEIHIRVPPPVHPDVAPDDPDRRARDIFESLTADLQAALQSGQLDQVNRVLGQMSVPEAEQVVAQFGEADILSLVDNRIFDFTTEEGKRELQELQELQEAVSLEVDPSEAAPPAAIAHADETLPSGAAGACEEDGLPVLL